MVCRQDTLCVIINEAAVNFQGSQLTTSTTFLFLTKVKSPKNIWWFEQKDVSL